MTSSNSLKKLISIGAAMLLAVGGSLVAAEPAQAVGYTIHWTSNDPNAVYAASGTSSYDQLNVVTTNNFAAPTVTNAGCTLSAWNEWVNGSNFSNRTFPLNLYMNADVEFRAIWSCPASLTTGPSVAISGTTATVTPGVWARGSVAGQWARCGLSVAAGSNMNGYFNSGAGGCEWLYTVSSGFTFANATSLNTASTLYTYGIPNNTPVTLAGYKLVWVEITTSGQSGFANAASVLVPAAVIAPPAQGSSSAPVVPESAKPLPVWAAPILKQVPTLSKTLNTDGGKLSLTDGDFSSLKSVTVGGKEVAYSIDAKGDVNIPVPAGKGGTTADLVIVFTGGKMTVQDGIKYVEPTNVAAVREAPIAGFKGNSTKITGALAESIQYAAQLDKKANTVLCTGYATSKAAVATATARAEAACGYATKVNDLLVNKKVTIVVNAKLAKTAAVGIKVYK